MPTINEIAVQAARKAIEVIEQLTPLPDCRVKRQQELWRREHARKAAGIKLNPETEAPGIKIEVNG